MTTGRTPANTTISLTGGLSVNGYNKNQGDNSSAKNALQPHLGNKCGHERKNPRFFTPPSHHKTRIPQVERAKDRLADSYFHPQKYDVSKIYWHHDKITKRGYFRKMRSEQREALSHGVAQSLLHHLNFKTMQVGHFDFEKKKFIHYKLDLIKRTSKCSAHQVNKVIKRLKAFGYITVTQQRIHPDDTYDGNFKSIAPIIAVTRSFLLDLGLTDAEIDHRTTVAASGEQAEMNLQMKKEYDRHERDVRKQKKIAKNKVIRHLADVMHDARLDKPLSKTDEALLDKECPGWRQSYRQPNKTNYRDYTGIAQNRAISTNSKPLDISTTAQSAIDLIRKSLLPPKR
jgi:hypothetical protein